MSAFQERLAALEGAEACVATASGMSAILAMAMDLLKTGDHVLCSASVFGSTVQLFSGVMGKFGVDTSFVAGASLAGQNAQARLKIEVQSPNQDDVAD